MVSALGMGWTRQRFQNRDAPDISKALRLPNRAQKKTMAALATVAVEMRGSGLRSVREAMSREERWNTFSEYAIKRRSKSGLPLLETFPFQFGDFLDEALHLLVVGNGLAHAFPPWLGDADLAKFAGMTLHQVHRLVQLALGAMAVGYAALAGTFRKSAPKEPLAGGQLGNAGAEVAFGGREFGAEEGLGHVLYHILSKIGMESKSKNAIGICSSLASGLSDQWSRMIWRATEFGCGILGEPGKPGTDRTAMDLSQRAPEILGSLVSPR